MTEDDLAYMELTALARAIADRELSALEVTRNLLERMSRLETTLGAYVAVLADSAEREAKAAAEVALAEISPRASAAKARNALIIPSRANKRRLDAASFKKFWVIAEKPAHSAIAETAASWSSRS